MSNRVPITLRLESFEGPLDLLLFLIQSHELDVSKISITRITDQYLAYVRLMQELNFDLASEFLVMAATLLLWKSKAILPQEGQADIAQGDDEIALTQDELLRQLLEHQRFLAAGEDLSRLPKLGEDVFVRPNRRPPVEKIWKTMDVTSLVLGYQEMLVRARKRTQILQKETVSLAGKIIEFSDRLSIGKPTLMSALISPGSPRAETVVTFLASLELSRLRKLRIYQQEVYQEIYLELLETLRGFDLALASGFEGTIEAQIESHAPLTGEL
jgi:segregation and condensation protein A